MCRVGGVGWFVSGLLIDFVLYYFGGWLGFLFLYYFDFRLFCWLCLAWLFLFCLVYMCWGFFVVFYFIIIMLFIFISFNSKLYILLLIDYYIEIKGDDYYEI